MNTCTTEITKERYEQLKAMSYSEQHDALFPDGVPAAWQYGYGYYGHSLGEKNGKYYVYYEIGSSCD